MPGPPMPRASDMLRRLFFEGGGGPIEPEQPPGMPIDFPNDNIIEGEGLPPEEPEQSPALAALSDELRGSGIRSFADPDSGTMTYTNQGTPMRSPEVSAAEELRNAGRAEVVTQARNRVDRELPVNTLTQSAGYQRMLRENPAAAARSLADVTQSASRMGNEPMPRRPAIATPGEEFSGLRSMLSRGRATQQLGEESADADTSRFLSPKSTAARAVSAAEREAAGRPDRFSRIRERLAGNPDLSMLEDPTGALGLPPNEPPAAPSGRVASMADVQDFAREQGITPQEAQSMFEAEGWVVQR